MVGRYMGRQNMVCTQFWCGRSLCPTDLSVLQPERINPELNQKGYNVKSDVWSLGITMVLPGARSLLVRWGWVVLCLGHGLMETGKYFRF